MSVINKMLQDLDARQADRHPGMAMPDEVRPLPQEPRSRAPGLVLASAVLLLAGAAAYYYLDYVAGHGGAPAPEGVAVAAPEPLPASSAVPAKGEHEAEPLPGHDVERRLRLSPRLSEVPAEPEGDAVVAPPVALPELSDNSVAKPRSAPKVVVAEAGPVLPTLPKTTPQVSDSAAPSPPVQTHQLERGSIEKTAPALPPADRLEAAFRRAAAAAGEGRSDEAIGALQQLLRQDGLHVGARQLLVRLLVDNGRQSEAIHSLQDGLQVQPARIAWAMTLARLQLEQGSLDKAAETLRFSLPAAASSPDYLGFAAHVEQRLGNFRDAAALYEQAARLAPNDGRWWLGRGLALEADGHNDQAMAAFERARRSGNLSSELRALVERKLR